MKKDRQYDFGQLKQWIKDHAREEKDFTEFLELIDLSTPTCVSSAYWTRS